MAGHKLDVSIAEMDVPLLIIVDKDKNVTVYENGVVITNLQSITFSAAVNELPIITTTKYPVL